MAVSGRPPAGPAPVVASPAPAPSKPVALAAPHRTVTLWVTAYCPTCPRCDTDDVTATGSSALRPGLAVAAERGSRAVSLGARVRVPGKGWLRVDDTGGRVGPSQLDLRVPTHEEAVRWGRRKLTVQIGTRARRVARSG